MKKFLMALVLLFIADDLIPLRAVANTVVSVSASGNTHVVLKVVKKKKGKEFGSHIKKAAKPVITAIPEITATMSASPTATIVATATPLATPDDGLNESNSDILDTPEKLCAEPKTPIPPDTFVFQKKSDWEFQVGFGLVPFVYPDSANLAPGFQLTPAANSLEPEISLQIGYQWIALEGVLNLGSQSVNMNVWGSGLGTIKISTPISADIKFSFFENNSPFRIFIGIGADYNAVVGNLSLGGYRFVTSGNGEVTPSTLGGFEVVKGGIGISIFGKLTSADFDTTVPGVGKQDIRIIGNVGMKLIVLPFNL